MADVDLAAIEMYRRDESVFVAPDIEYNPITNFVGRRECGPQFAEITEIRVLHHLEPANECRSAIWMLLPEQAQRLAGDDMHDLIISHIEIFQEWFG